MRGGSLRGVAQATGIRIRIGNIAGLQGIAWHHGFLLPELPITRPLSNCFQLRKSSLFHAASHACRRRFIVTLLSCTSALIWGRISARTSVLSFTSGELAAWPYSTVE